MARQGIYERNENTLTRVPRSLQLLEHRHTGVARFGEIKCNFSEVLLPNETLTLQATNFLRTLPLKVPMMTRVRIVQRFVAVPIRILWHAAEEYFKDFDGKFLYEEPYIANFNSMSTMPFTVGDGRLSYNIYHNTISEMKSLATLMLDFSTMGVKNARFNENATYSFARAFNLADGTAESSLPAIDNAAAGYQFFPRELGDDFNAPLFSVALARDRTTRFSAFKFAAYQLAYSFMYRQPNVQERVDDYYEGVFTNERGSWVPEYKQCYTRWDQSTRKFVPSISDMLTYIASHSDADRAQFFNAVLTDAEKQWALVDHAKLSDTDSVNETSRP